MAENITKFLTLAGLQHYDTKIKAFLANADLQVMNKVTQAQNEIDALEALVGTLPADAGVETVIAYIDKKTSGIATSAALAQLQETVNAIDEAVKAIQADYLKKSDKDELTGLITAETERATGIEAGLESRLKAVEDDYLVAQDRIDLEGLITAEADRAKAAEKVSADAITALSQTHATDKAALEANIQKNTDAIGVLNGTGEGSVDKKIDDAFNDFATKVSDDNVVNSYKELIDYAAEHGAEFTELVGVVDDIDERLKDAESDIDTNAQAISNEQARAEGIESGLAERLTNLEETVGTTEDGKTVAEQISEAVKTVQDEVDALETEVAKKADTTTVEGINTRLGDAETDIDALQAKFGEGEGTVSDMISDAVAVETAAREAAITKTASDAATDATTKANQALTDAKAHTNTEVGKDRTRLDALEADTHTHSNKALLDTYDQSNANIKSAVDQKHTHENKSVIDGITAEKVTAWSNSEANAKNYADGLNTAMDARMDAVEAWRDSCAEISTADIDALFA